MLRNLKLSNTKLSENFQCKSDSSVNNETYGWDIIWIFSISFCSHFRDISHKSQLKQLKKLYCWTGFGVRWDLFATVTEVSSYLVLTK